LFQIFLARIREIDIQGQALPALADQLIGNGGG
jgi:hypothetical protein